MWQVTSAARDNKLVLFNCLFAEQQIVVTCLWLQIDFQSGKSISQLADTICEFLQRWDVSIGD